MDETNLSPQLEFGGPWEGLGTEAPLSTMQRLAQTMRNKLQLRRNKTKISSSSNVSLQHHQQYYNTNARIKP
jgi:hypothetical protein